MRLDTLALLYDPEGYSIGGEKLMGRQAAGAGFLRALARSKLQQVYAFSPREQFWKHMAGEMRRYGATTTAIDWIPYPAHRRLGEAGLLYLPDPNLKAMAWHRSRHDPKSYSLCGITHTLMSKIGMELVSALPLSPVEEWDALICTSQTVKDSVHQILRAQAEFLTRRLSARRMPVPQLPVIPLGVHSADFVRKPGDRERARAALGIDEDEIVLLYVGRLSPHAKAHPLPMLLAAEEASKGKSVVLLQAGWFASERLESAVRAEAVRFSRSLRHIFVDGRKPDELKRAWAAGDVFTSLVDNFQETFGLTPIEAMAAGLPCVVTDWDGYKETVRHEVDGFRVPTVTLPPGPAEFLTEGFDLGIFPYDAYCGMSSQLVAVDIARACEAYRALFTNDDLRRTMGEAAQSRARSEFDWSRIMDRYHELWRELENRRRGGAEPGSAKGVINPARLSPFALCHTYASGLLAPTSSLELVSGATLESAKERLETPTLQPGYTMLTNPRAVADLVRLANSRAQPTTLEDIQAALPAMPRDLLIRTAVALLKVGILRLADDAPTARLTNLG